MQPEHLQEDTVSAHFGDPCIGISVEHERRFAAGLEVGSTVLAVGHPWFFHRLWWWKRIATESCDRELGLVAVKRQRRNTTAFKELERFPSRRFYRVKIKDLPQ
jgi:hypothetical protein